MRAISDATSPVPGKRIPRWLTVPGSPPTLRQDDRRIGDLELGIVVSHLGRLLAQELPVSGDGGLEVLTYRATWKCSCDLLVVNRRASTAVDISPLHRYMSISSHVDATEGGACSSRRSSDLQSAATMPRRWRRRSRRSPTRADPLAELHCGSARCGGLRLPPRRAARASQPTVSHHLRVLTEAGSLARERRGTWMFYRLVLAKVEDLRTALALPDAKVPTKRSA